MIASQSLAQVIITCISDTHCNGLKYICILCFTSANINDRSMTGDRDSEVAVRYEDTEMVCRTIRVS